MSRIGKKPIDIPSGIKVAFQAPTISVEGPKGKLKSDVSSLVAVQVGEKQIECKFTGRDDQRSIHGITRTMIMNMVHGCHTGFEKVLEINGVGYRAALKGKDLDISLGFSHPVLFPIPEGITITVDKQTILTIKGADKQLVGQVAAEIRELRKPEPYKGKGVKYQTEVIKRKAGKSAAAA